MKHVSLSSIVIIAYLLFISCSPKETFLFSKSTGSFGQNQKVQNEGNLRNSLIIHNRLTDIDRSNNTDSPVVTATTASAENPELLTSSKRTQARGFNASIPAKKVERHPYLPVVKNKTRQNHAIKKYLDDPVANKKIQRAALAGFILSLAALVTFFAGSWPLAALFGIIGSVLGIVGVTKIMKNPAKYSGRGFAWSGIIVGLVIALSLVGFVLAYAGAI